MTKTKLFLSVFLCASVLAACESDGGGGSDGGTISDGGTDTTVPMDGQTDTGAPPDTGAPDTTTGDTAVGDATLDADDGGPPQTCSADQDLASAMGVDVATGNTEGADDSNRSGCAGDNGGLDTVYSWTAPSAGTFVFDTMGSDYDTTIDIRDASCASISCNDDTGGDTQSWATATLTDGQQVFIVVDGFSAEATGSFKLSITDVATESNCTDEADDDRDSLIDCDDSDCAEEAECTETGAECSDEMDNDMDGATDCDDTDCAAFAPCVEQFCDDNMDNDMDGDEDCADSECTCDPACVSDTCPDMDLAMMVGASVASGSTPEGGCSLRNGGTDMCENTIDGSTPGGGPEVTLEWTAPSAGSYTFDTEGSTYDTVIYLLQAACDGTQLACDDDGGEGTRSSLTTDLTAGQTVIIVIDGFGSSSVGDWVLNITAN